MAVPFYLYRPLLCLYCTISSAIMQCANCTIFNTIYCVFLYLL
nr:MAG TPA: hypothetical protein [Caudoviricetes sp.]